MSTAATQQRTITLAHSPDLPKSIYDDGDELFGAADRDQLIRSALGLGAQAGFGPQRPTFSYGLPLNKKPTDRVQRFQFQVGTVF